jgi:RHS repeat-associated protein
MQNLSSFSQGQARFSNGFFGIYHSPFGVELKGRNLKKNNAKNYRFGFQGQEGDDEIKGDGNSVNYSFRMHDPRLGRFFAVDPLSRQYASITVYSFSHNRVIDCKELEGKELDPAITITATQNTSCNLYMITGEDLIEKTSSVFFEKSNFTLLCNPTIQGIHEKTVNYMAENNIDCISTLVFVAHGGPTGMFILNEEKPTPSSTQSVNSRVTMEGLNSVKNLRGLKHKWEIESFHANLNTQQKREFEVATEFLGILSWTNSNIVLISCYIGQVDAYGKLIFELTDKKVDLYLNNDKCSLNMLFPFCEPLTDVKLYSKGFDKVSCPDGKTIETESLNSTILIDTNGGVEQCTPEP